MCRNISIGSILVLLLALGLYAFRLLELTKTIENYVFFGFIILLFTIVYSVSVLGYRITGSNIGVEEAVKEIAASKKEITKVTEAFVRIAYLLADGTARWGGMPSEHMDQVKKEQESLKEYLSSDLDSEIKKTISEINTQIEARNKSQKPS